MTTESETLEHLLLAVAGGDKGAFRRLYDLAAPRIWPVVQGIAARHNCAEDVLQEAFIAIWQRADQYQPERGSAMSWMIAIARYRALDALRRRRPEVSVEDFSESESWADPAPGPLDQALRSATARAVHQCLGGLEQRSRDCIQMAYHFGYSHSELAKRLDTPLGTVKSLIRRGLLGLKRCLESGIEA